jgi:hypothetical protein
VPTSWQQGRARRNRKYIKIIFHILFISDYCTTIRFAGTSSIVSRIATEPPHLEVELMDLADEDSESGADGTGIGPCDEDYINDDDNDPEANNYLGFARSDFD